MLLASAQKINKRREKINLNVLGHHHSSLRGFSGATHSRLLLVAGEIN